MSKKQWGYLIKIFIVDEEEHPIHYQTFEALGISPFLIEPSVDMEFMHSRNYENIANPMVIGNFIEQIGDKNTLSIKKLLDSKSDILKSVFDAKEHFYGIRVGLAPLAKISPKLTGESRLKTLESLELVSVGLKTAVVTRYFSFRGSYRPHYDLITFEAEEVIFDYKGTSEYFQ